MLLLEEIKVTKINRDTGEPEFDAQGRQIILTGADAVEQNVYMQIMAHDRQQHTGPLWTDPFGLGWRRQTDMQLGDDDTPGLIGERRRPSEIALYMAMAANRATGVDRVVFADARATENRGVHVDLKYKVVGRDVPITQRIELTPEQRLALLN